MPKNLAMRVLYTKMVNGSRTIIKTLPSGLAAQSAQAPIGAPCRHCPKDQIND